MDFQGRASFGCLSAAQAPMSRNALVGWTRFGYCGAVRLRLGPACLATALIISSGWLSGTSGLTGAQPDKAVSEAGPTSPPSGMTLGSQIVPACPTAQTSEKVTAPDYALARWVPAAPANFSVANRPHDCPIDMIVIHDTEVPFAQAIRLFQDPTREAAANYIVSAHGQVVQMVPEKDVAWHAGNWDYNTRAIGIEHEGYAWTPGSFTNAEYRASAELAASICSRWGVPMDRAHVIGHYQVPDDHHPGLFGGESHRTDPGPYWNWNYYLSLAASDAMALPSPPRMMVDPVAVNGLNSATVSWQPARSCHLPILGYTVVAQPGGLTSYLPATATSTTFNNLQAGTIYTFTVTAVDADGRDSLTSNAVIPGRCNAVELIALRSPSEPYGSTVPLHGVAADCHKPLYAFALLAPGSSTWTVAQPYSVDSVFEWGTTGYRTGMYSIRLLVRDAGSPGTYSSALGSYDGYQDAIYSVTTTTCSRIEGSPSQLLSTSTTRSRFDSCLG